MESVKLTAEEITRRGEDLYDRDLRAKAEREHRGRFLVLDVLSGRYEIADDDLTATLRLLDRVPGAMTYAVRIGHAEAYRLGSVAPAQRW